MSYHGYGGTALTAPAAATRENVGDLYDRGVLTWAQADAVCKAVGLEFNDSECATPGSEGTASAGAKLVAADTRATWLLVGGVALVLWVLLR